MHIVNNPSYYQQVDIQIGGNSNLLDIASQKKQDSYTSEGQDHFYRK